MQNSNHLFVIFVFWRKFSVLFTVFEHLGLDTRMVVECILLPVISVLFLVSLLKICLLANRRLVTTATLMFLDITGSFLIRTLNEITEIVHSVKHSI